MTVEGETPLHSLHLSESDGSILAILVIKDTAGTFDVQDVVIREKRSGQYEITCYFASGSKVKGCRIVIISERRDCELHTTATRQEGAGDAVVNVTLPAGEYSVVVYDDELVTEENPAFNTTLSVTVPGTIVAGIIMY